MDGMRFIKSRLGHSGFRSQSCNCLPGYSCSLLRFAYAIRYASRTHLSSLVHRKIALVQFLAGAILPTQKKEDEESDFCTLTAILLIGWSNISVAFSRHFGSRQQSKFSTSLHPGPF